MNQMLSSSIEQRIEKNCLIIYSKGIDFFSNSKLKRSQLNPFGAYIQKKYENYSQTKSQYYSFYLYYKGDSEPKAIDQFKTQIEFPYQIVKEAVTKDHLLLLYNIIEFEDKFKTRNAHELETLLTQLIKFDSSKKTLEEFLLFTYYRAVLNFYLKNYDESYEHFMTVIIDINEEAGDIEKYPFIHYLLLKNNLFMWRISQITLNQKKQIEMCDSSELIVLSKDIFTQFKKISPVNAIKMGLILFDLYLEKENYASGYQILSESYQLFQTMAFRGNGIDNAPELSLQLISKLSYLSVFLAKEDAAKLAKKMQKKYLLLEDHLRSSSAIKKRQYAFCCFILNSISYPKHIQSSASSSSSAALNEFKSLLNQQDINYDVYLMNLYFIHSLDPMSSKAFSEKFEAFSATLSTNKPLLPKDFIPCFFYIYNVVSSLTKSITTEPNYAKQKENNNSVRTFSDYILNYTKANFDDTNLRNLFQLSYIRILLIRIVFCRCSTELFEKKYDKLKEALNDFDKTKHIYVNRERNVLNEYGTIVKLKGDLEFKQENYMKAANYYQDALKNMRNHKMMALIYYNLGTCFYCLKDAKKAKVNLTQSLKEYLGLQSKPKSSTEFKSKIAKTEKILKYFD